MVSCKRMSAKDLSALLGAPVVLFCTTKSTVRYHKEYCLVPQDLEYCFEPKESCLVPQRVLSGTTKSPVWYHIYICMKLRL
jgi:hypothetical protein